MANIYSAPDLSTMKVSTFKGSDCSVPEDQQKAYRAAKSENMMPYAVGEVGKRPGVQTDEDDEISALIKGYGGTVAAKAGDMIITSTAEGYDVFVLQDSPFSITQREKVRLFKGLAEIPVFSEYEDQIVLLVHSENPITADFFTAQTISFHSAICVIKTNIIHIHTDNETIFSGGKGAVTINRKAEKGSATATWFVIGGSTTIPHVMQGCHPAGGGEPLEAINMLSHKVKETFCVESGECSVFHLNVQAISADEYETDRLEYQDISGKFSVRVRCLVEEEENGETVKTIKWIERPLGEKDAYRISENRLFLHKEHNPAEVATGSTGCIGITPIEGEDNVEIVHVRADAKKDMDTICSAKCMTRYGVGGHKDRLVLGGGDLKFRVYYSEMDDPLYISDINYIDVDDGVEVVTLDGTTDVLTILTNKGVYFGSASALDTTDNAGYVRDTIITISNRIPAPLPKKGVKTAILGGEVVYLSTEGVIAIASKENYAARYAEHRSAMIDREMLQDDPQELISLGRFLMIRCADGVWWLLDENQPNSEGDKPYASHQYEGWRLTGMYCDSAFEENGTLYLIKGGTAYRWADGTKAEHFHDEYDGTETAITAWWEVPWIYGGTFYKNKIFKKLGILLGQLNGVDTCVKIEGKKNDETEWTVLWDYDGTLCTFGYDKFDYRLFTYATQSGDPNQSRKIKIKKAKRFKLRFTNDFINQPLILREYGLDYVQEN